LGADGNCTAGSDAISQNIVIRNNSIRTNSGTGIELNEGSSHAIVSNAIQATGSSSGWNCLDATMSAANYNVIDHNVCGFSAGEWANGVGDLAAWQVLGWGANSIADAPGFVSGTDLRPGSETAVLVNAGSPTLSSLMETAVTPCRTRARMSGWGHGSRCICR
jgi:hypothetical protein